MTKPEWWDRVVARILADLKYFFQDEYPTGLKVIVMILLFAILGLAWLIKFGVHLPGAVLWASSHAIPPHLSS